MLRKLIRYELKATGRFMLLMYGLLLALSVIMAVGFGLNLDEVMENIAREFQLGSLILSVFAVLIVTSFVIMNVVVLSGMFFYAIKRFKDNLLGDEGYLMHTLPVSTHSHIIAKCTVSVIWTITSFIVTLISFFILLFGITKTNMFEEVSYIVTQIWWSEFPVTKFLAELTEFAIHSIIGLIGTYLHIYASMAIGFSANTHRAAKSIGAYVLITIIADIFEIVVHSVVTISDISGIIISALSALTFYFVTYYFLNKKLNLQS